MAENNYQSCNTDDNEQRKFTVDGDLFGDTVVNTKNVLDKIGDSKLLIGLDLIPGMEQRGKAAFNEEVDQSVIEDIMIGGGQYVFAPTAQTLDISSTSGNDAVAGTGARTVLVRGTDDLFNEITESGTIPFTTTQLFRRVNDFQVTSVGSSEFNEGIITADQTTSGIVMSTIQADPKGNGVNTSQQFILTVPNGKTMAVTSLIGGTSRMVGAGGVKEAGFFFLARLEGGVFIPSGFASTRSDGSSITVVTPNYPVTFPEKTDIRARGVAFTNNAALTVVMQYTLIDNAIFGL